MLFSGDKWDYHLFHIYAKSQVHMWATSNSKKETKKINVLRVLVGKESSLYPKQKNNLYI